MCAGFVCPSTELLFEIVMQQQFCVENNFQMELLIANTDHTKIFGSKIFQQKELISSCLLGVSSSLLSTKPWRVSLAIFPPNYRFYSHHNCTRRLTSASSKPVGKHTHGTAVQTLKQSKTQQTNVPIKVSWNKKNKQTTGYYSGIIYYSGITWLACLLRERPMDCQLGLKCNLGCLLLDYYSQGYRFLGRLVLCGRTYPRRDTS